eukprot:RCo043186
MRPSRGQWLPLCFGVCLSFLLVFAQHLRLTRPHPVPTGHPVQPNPSFPALHENSLSLLERVHPTKVASANEPVRTASPTRALVKPPGAHAEPKSSEAVPWVGRPNKLMEMYERFEPLNDTVCDSPLDYWEHHAAARMLYKRYLGMRAAMLSGAVPRRVVIVYPVGQLCNRLLSIASGFVLALLSGRALVVQDGGFYASLWDLFD